MALVAGVDEVGRGPLAGPVVVAAVVLPVQHTLQGLADSKVLSAKKRGVLFTQIVEQAAVSVVSLSPAVIDRINIRAATLLAMRRAVLALPCCPHRVLVDGRDFPEVPFEGEAIIGGDGNIEAISAASIVAKTLRDRMMERLDAVYPHYGFAKHKGYGTAQHLAALREHGPCPHHRMSFAPCSAVQI